MHIRFLKAGLKKPCFFFILFATLIIFCSCKKKRPNEFNFQILYTANSLGKLYPAGCGVHPQGGLEHRSTLIKTLKKENSIMLDGGDSLFINHTLDTQNKKRFEEFKADAKKYVSVMNKFGLTAMALGETELAGSYEFFKELQKQAKYPVISLNAKDKNNIIKTHVLKKIQDVKILITAIDGDIYVNPYITSKNIQTSNDYIAPAKKLIKNLKPDFTILISHSSSFVIPKLAEALPEVDIILAAHSKDKIEYMKENNIPVVYTGYFGQVLAAIDIKMKLNKTTKLYSKEIQINLHAIEPKSMKADPEITELLSK